MLLNYCISGSLRVHAENEDISLGKGDLAAGMQGDCHYGLATDESGYAGIIVRLHLCETMRFVSRPFKLFSIDLHTLKDKLCPNNKGFVLRSNSEVSNILSEIGNVPAEVRREFFQLRLLDLLLFLSTLTPAPPFAGNTNRSHA